MKEGCVSPASHRHCERMAVEGKSVSAEDTLWTLSLIRVNKSTLIGWVGTPKRPF